MCSLVEVLKANHTKKTLNSELYTLAKRIAENIISRCYINKHRTVSFVPERMFGADICLFVWFIYWLYAGSLHCLALLRLCSRSRLSITISQFNCAHKWQFEEQNYVRINLIHLLFIIIICDIKPHTHTHR